MDFVISPYTLFSSNSNEVGGGAHQLIKKARLSLNATYNVGDQVKLTHPGICQEADWGHIIENKNWQNI